MKKPTISVSEVRELYEKAQNRWNNDHPDIGTEDDPFLADLKLCERSEEIAELCIHLSEENERLKEQIDETEEEFEHICDGCDICKHYPPGDDDPKLTLYHS